MKKVIFVYAGESERMSATLHELRNTLDGNVEFVEDDRKSDTIPNSGSEWVLKNASVANYIVIFFAADKADIPGGTHEAPHITKKAAYHTPSLSPSERAQLPEKPTVITIVFSSKDRDRIPADLAEFPIYDVSTSAMREAFLCRLAHDPVKPIPPRVREEATSAVLKMIMAGIAMLIGASDKTTDYLLDQFGETVSQTVHYCMATVVLLLIFAGLLALLRIMVNQVRPLLKNPVFINPPGGAKFGQKVLVGFAIVLSIIIGICFFPKAPQIDKNLTKHLREWTLRLQSSQRPNDGINENIEPKIGVPQVWSTAQSLAGLLSSQPWSTMPATNIQHAFKFIDRTRIVDLKLKPDKKNDIDQQLMLLTKRTDITNLPTNFPTFTMALDMINGFGRVMPPELIELLGPMGGKYYSSNESLEGWGYHEQFEWGVTEIAAWVAIAEIQSLRATNPPVWTSPEQLKDLKNSVRGIIELLRSRQRQDGAFSPIKEFSTSGFARTYSTVMALWAMSEAASPELKIYDESELFDLESSISDAVKWLGTSMVSDKGGSKGWLVNPANPTGEDPFLGLTAQTLSVLGRVPTRIDNESRTEFTDLKKRLLSSAGVWTRRSLKPNEQINDRMHDSDAYLYPTAKSVELSTFLWYPWSISLLRSLSSDPALSRKERHMAEVWLKRLQARAGEFGNVIEASGFNYVAAETLVGFNWPMDVRNKQAP